MLSCMSGKQGWLRVVEACVALIILIGFTALIMNKTRTEETNLQEKADEFVLKIEKDENVREMIFNNEDCNDIEDYLRNDIMKEIDFTFGFEKGSIIRCEPETLPNKDVFTSSVLLASSSENIKFTLYIWK